ncbi:hypothetical protein BGZ94_006141 [Podila epigama]|nr:hypothetical protein BGZ94_006141 [Podila epigama]
MSTLEENIHNLACHASFEPIDPAERNVTRDLPDSVSYFWPVEASELERLRTVFEEDSISLKGTWASRPRTNCHNCGKREEFLDQIYTASKQSAHPPGFMKAVVTGKIPAIGAGTEHNMFCSGCDTQLEHYHWDDPPSIWIA